ncbi:MAG: helix-turn-helix transcriptional regulator [Solirubrobacteraceae bacterium]|jgi:transcriptional regulator with XRE-family HTH domain
MPASPDPQVALGRAIRLRREELGLEQQAVALDAGVKPSWISHIESGRQNPAWGTVDRIARALGWSIAQLAQLADELETEDRRPTNEPLPPRD